MMGEELEIDYRRSGMRVESEKMYKISANKKNKRALFFVDRMM